MEVRKTPRHDAHQELLAFEIGVRAARARARTTAMPLGNDVRHFDVPAATRRCSSSRDRACGSIPCGLGVESLPAGHLRRTRPRDGARRALGLPAAVALRARDRACSRVRRRTRHGARGRPAGTMRRLTDTLNREMAYVPESTRVDTSTDEAVADAARRLPGLRAPRGHARADVRHPVPLRERVPRVHRDEGRPSGREPRVGRGVVAGARVDRASIPTHNIVTGVHHIRVAVGRDYADVPPTRGVCKGEALGRLAVAVRVWEAAAAPRRTNRLWSSMLAEAGPSRPGAWRARRTCRSSSRSNSSSQKPSRADGRPGRRPRSRGPS